MRYFYPLVATIALTTGCGHPSAAGIGESHTALSAALAPVNGCSGAANAVKQAALAAMNKELDDNLAQALVSGGYCVYADAVPTAAGATGSGSGSAPTAVSHTNNQVAGVDEADFVKNDNQYIYALAQNALHVVQAWPAADAREVSRTAIPGTPLKMFVEGGRAVVYTSLAAKNPESDGIWYSSPNYGGCTYGYDCDVSGDGSATRVLVYDLTHPEAPALLRSIDISSSFIAARRIGSVVHTVLASPSLVASQSRWPADLACGEQDPTVIRAAFAKLRADNTAAIEASVVPAAFVNLQDSLTGASGADCKNFYASATHDGTALTSVLSFDMQASSAPALQTVITRPGFVYSSATALYMTVRQAPSAESYYAGSPNEVSSVHKFNLGAQPSDTAYVASGFIPGHALSQYAMDEWQGNLRVATSVGFVPDPAVTSSISVLQEQNGTLSRAGAVDGIAPHEDIRAVRFDGARGYVVTFKKTDPLYVFDLSEAAHPTVLGELQIPGFSTYMHMMDANHLLTIGYDAQDEGNFAWFAGLLLQIFDVSNPASPQRLHVESIGTRGSSSQALDDPLAFNYFAQENLLAIPLTVCEGGNGGSYGTNMTFSGLAVYNVTAGNGFTQLGRIAHPNSGTGYDNSLCMNWWANASSEVKRSIIMDRFVYSISESVIKVDALDTLGTDLASIPLQ